MDCLVVGLRLHGHDGTSTSTPAMQSKDYHGGRAYDVEFRSPFYTVVTVAADALAE